MPRGAPNLLRRDDQRDGASRAREDLAHFGAEIQALLRASIEHAHHKQVVAVLARGRDDDIFGPLSGRDSWFDMDAKLSSEEFDLLDELAALVGGTVFQTRPSRALTHVKGGKLRVERARVLHRDCGAYSRKSGSGYRRQDSLERNRRLGAAQDYDRCVSIEDEFAKNVAADFVVPALVRGAGENRVVAALGLLHNRLGD